MSAPLPFRIRPYETRDFETLYRIDRACYPRGIYYPRPVLQRFIAAPGAHTLVAEREREILAFIIVEKHDDGRGHIITIDVLSAYRRTGVGSALLRAGEDWLARHGAHTVELETSVENTPAIGLFQKFGYEVVRYLPDYYRNHADAYLMERSLPPMV